MTEQESPIYEPGDVVYGVDPYKGGAAARPSVVSTTQSSATDPTSGR